MIDFLQYCQWKLTLKAEILRLLLRAGAMIEARDHNGCTVMALDDIVFHETWCDYVREFVLVFCENNSIVNNNNNNNNNNNKKKKKKKNNNENSTEFSVLQILTALNFQLCIDLLVFEALMFAAGTGNVAGLQVLLDKQANPTVEDYQATGNGYSYPTLSHQRRKEAHLPKYPWMGYGIVPRMVNQLWSWTTVNRVMTGEWVSPFWWKHELGEIISCIHLFGSFLKSERDLNSQLGQGNSALSYAKDLNHNEVCQESCWNFKIEVYKMC